MKFEGIVTLQIFPCVSVEAEELKAFTTHLESGVNCSCAEPLKYPYFDLVVSLL